VCSGIRKHPIFASDKERRQQHLHGLIVLPSHTCPSGADNALQLQTLAFFWFATPEE
jgi:hypothetical protein